MKKYVKLIAVVLVISLFSVLMPGKEILAIENVVGHELPEGVEFDFETGELKKYKSDKFDIVIPSEIDGVPVKKLQGAFLIIGTQQTVKLFIFQKL